MPRWSTTVGGASQTQIVDVLTLKGQSAGATATPNSTPEFATNQAQPIGPLGLTVPSGGVGAIFAAGGMGTGSGAVAFSWTNATSYGDENGARPSNSTQAGTAHISATANVSYLATIHSILAVQICSALSGVRECY